jgi:endoglucanase
MPPLSGFYPTTENFENSANFVCNTWAQISQAFNNGYDQHLIFEVLNEPRLAGTGEEWWYNPASKKSIEAMQNLNKLNQAILDVIRASGGNNKKRLVAFPSLQASPDAAMALLFKMPQDYDLSKDRLILSVHMYTPSSFAMESPGNRQYSDNVKKEFTSIFKNLNTSFIEKGYAVYIGEYGATNKNNLKDRVAWFKDFNKEAKTYGMPCILWDNGVWKVENDDYEEHYGFYNRTEGTWFFPDILAAILKGVNDEL